MRPTIFRQKSVQQHHQGHDVAMIPQFISPRVFLYLWLLLVVSVIGSAAVWLIDVPVYTSGQAIRVSDRTLIALFPPERQPYLYEGQTLFLQIENRRVPGAIVRLLPDLSTSETVGQQYQLNNHITSALIQPAAVVVVRLQTDGMAAGTIYEAEVASGKRPMLSLLPFLSVE
jgi:hypothetical protein